MYPSRSARHPNVLGLYVNLKEDKKEKGPSSMLNMFQAAWKITHPEDKLNKAYPCEMCSMSFSQKWLLKRHWKTHTGDKPYKCSICLRSFSLRDSCTRHLKTVHKELVMSEDVSNLVEYEDSNVEPNSVISVEYDRSPQPSALVV